MRHLIYAFLVMGAAMTGAEEALRPVLERCYEGWRDSIERRDARVWQQVTAEHRRVEVKNRILSERRSFPSALFDLPAPPPRLAGLRFLDVKQVGPTAKLAYFGRVDFGVGGEPSENLLVLSFVHAQGRWLYDRADFVNLVALPEVRKELAAGQLAYLNETPEARPSGVLPAVPYEVGMAKYIAKVYVFCPGREVQVQVNKMSRHQFLNAKEADLVIGGARDGSNEVQFTVRSLKGGTGKEAMTIRVYLMSQVLGVKPVKAFEYQVDEGGQVKPVGTLVFEVDATMAKKVMGR